MKFSIAILALTALCALVSARKFDRKAEYERLEKRYTLGVKLVTVNKTSIMCGGPKPKPLRTLDYNGCKAAAIKKEMPIFVHSRANRVCYMYKRCPTIVPDAYTDFQVYYQGETEIGEEAFIMEMAVWEEMIEEASGTGDRNDAFTNADMVSKLRDLNDKNPEQAAQMIKGLEQSKKYVTKEKMWTEDDQKEAEMKAQKKGLEL